MDMDALASRSFATRTHGERMEVARGLWPLLVNEADQGEALNHLSDPALAAMKDAGILHLLLPRELGGEQASCSEAMEVIESMARADGSAGWYALVANAAAASVGAYLPEQGAQVIYGDNPLAIVAGQGAPRGKARKVDGGYLINGPWSYGSTIYHADYLHAGCTIVDSDGKPSLDKEGRPQAIVCHFPKSQGVLSGNWDTLGLKGTGSYDYDCAEPDLFVPDYMCYSLASQDNCRGGKQYSIGIVGFTSLVHAAWALGAARHALDEIRQLAPNKAGAFTTLSKSAVFIQSYAHAEAQYRAARSLLRDTWREIDEILAGEGSVSLELIARARMAMRHIHDVGSEVATFAFRAGGGVSLRSSNLQRVFRDMHSATQHGLMSDTIFQDCGRIMLGWVGPNARWTSVGITED